MVNFWPAVDSHLEPKGQIEPIRYSHNRFESDVHAPLLDVSWENEERE